MTNPEPPSFWYRVLLVFATTFLVLGTAAVLWLPHDDKAHGVALALVGGALTHLLKEAHELLRGR